MLLVGFLVTDVLNDHLLVQSHYARTVAFCPEMQSVKVLFCPKSCLWIWIADFALRNPTVRWALATERLTRGYPGGQEALQERILRGSYGLCWGVLCGAAGQG